MRDRLRIRDVQLYIRDLLVEYSKLQRFAPVQSQHARCMDWQRLLLEFEWPHYTDVSILINISYSHRHLLISTRLAAPAAGAAQMRV